MSALFEYLHKSRFAKISQPLATKDLILLQKHLAEQGFSQLPESFINILHISNGISYNTGDILGAFPQTSAIKDLLSENIRLSHDGNILILGKSEMDFFIYNSEKKVYQIVDRDDMEVLNEYEDKEVEQAICAFLKVGYEQNL